MSTTLYTEQDNGNLKLVAEVEDIDNAALAVDALLDASPRLKDREFVALVGSLEDGTIERVTVEDDAPVNPRRAIVSTRVNGAVVEAEAPKRTTRRKPGPKPGGARRKPGPKPAAKPAARKPAAKPAARKKAAAKPAAKRTAARKPAAKKPAGAKKASPFKAKHDDE